MLLMIRLFALPELPVCGGGWTLTEEQEEIQDGVAFAEDAWYENAAAFEQMFQLNTVLALDADDAASDDEVLK